MVAGREFSTGPAEPVWRWFRIKRNLREALETPALIWVVTMARRWLGIGCRGGGRAYWPAFRTRERAVYVTRRFGRPGLRANQIERE